MNFKALIQWSKREYPHLPWRKNRSLYRTLVSEIMLQQTTVGTVKNHFERFLDIFPDLNSLAEASEQKLLISWKGLGYYRRAKNLKKIAEAIQNDHQGDFPSELDQLQSIPGIGPYTANAIVAIGMDRPALAVDANLERVISRLWALEGEKGLKQQLKIQHLFLKGQIFSDKKISFRELNEALMDLGRTICQSRKASCELCPLSKGCRSFAQGNPLDYPTASVVKKKLVEHELHLLRVFIIKDKKILVYQKEDHEWLSGQFEVPTFIMKTTDKKLMQYPKIKKQLGLHDPGFTYKTGITKYKIQNSILQLDKKDLKSLGFTRATRWVDLSSEEANFSTATIKGLKKLGL